MNKFSLFLIFISTLFCNICFINAADITKHEKTFTQKLEAKDKKNTLAAFLKKYDKKHLLCSIILPYIFLESLRVTYQLNCIPEAFVEKVLLLLPKTIIKALKTITFSCSELQSLFFESYKKLSFAFRFCFGNLKSMDLDDRCSHYWDLFSCKEGELTIDKNKTFSYDIEFEKYSFEKEVEKFYESLSPLEQQLYNPDYKAFINM